MSIGLSNTIGNCTLLEVKSKCNTRNNMRQDEYHLASNAFRSVQIEAGVVRIYILYKYICMEVCVL